MRSRRIALALLLTLLARETVVIHSVTMAAGDGGALLRLPDAPDAHLRASRWWALHETRYSAGDFDLQGTRGHFTAQQWSSFSPKRCGFDSEILRAAVHGVQVAIRECERQMVTERWNCSRIAANYQGDNVFGKILWKGIPETAFVLAMVSAGVTASIASECRRSLRCCPCRMTLDGVNATADGAAASPGSVTHAGCDHNSKFARTFSKNLMERSERGRGVRYLAMLHNYNAGRRAVIRTMGTRCLCHGTSGSCTHRICWREVANFQAIGNYLKERYLNPVRVAQGSPVKIFIEGSAGAGGGGARGGGGAGSAAGGGGGGSRRERRRQRRLNLVKAGGQSQSGPAALPRKQDLVFYENIDPNFFCTRDKFWSVLGVQKRVCNLGQGNCTHICCGGTYKIEYYKHVDSKCNCRFVWCCEVKCQTCVTDRQRKICD